MLMAQVKQIRVANGQESVELLSGARYEIVAATRDERAGHDYWRRGFCLVSGGNWHQ